ncbi:MAG: hypothetical protein P4L69_05385 [Desulfosporosinus sp.]|nr:hypothetical protein [Desulfosporosinus sp.]
MAETGFQESKVLILIFLHVGREWAVVSNIHSGDAATLAGSGNGNLCRQTRDLTLSTLPVKSVWDISAKPWA